MSHRPEKRAYVTDAAHMPSLLETNPLLPPMLLRFTEYLGGIIAGASHFPSTEWKESRVRCRRRPGHRPCPGPINVRTGCEDPPEILWECPSCGRIRRRVRRLGNLESRADTPSWPQPAFLLLAAKRGIPCAG
jgi:hypothetical protein